MQAIIALSAAGLIEKYGAYAGLAAIPGLAVLSLLYFAQAREVRRLREWAGRAPERDLERSTSGVHVAPTGARDPVSVVRRQPPPAAARPTGGGPRPAAGQPASAEPAAAAKPASAAKPAPPAKPAPASPGAAVPAAATAADSAGAQGAAPPKPEEKPAPASPTAEPDDADAPGSTPSPEAQPVASPSPTPATNGPGDPSHVERPAAPAAQPASDPPADRPTDRPLAPAAATAAGAAGARAAVPVSDRPAPATARPATPGASASRAAPLRADRPRATPGGRPGGRDPVPPRRAADGGRPRRAAYIAVAAVLVIILVVVIVAATSGGGSKSNAPNKITPTQPTGASKQKPSASPVPRGDVKVAVLNGTTQAGLASQVGDQIAASGFKRGEVTNANDQQAPQTVVYYASGQRRAGQEVANVVKASSVQPIDPDTQALAGSDAKVVVLVGADKT